MTNFYLWTNLDANRSRDIIHVFDVSKMAAIRHLGFVILQFWTTHEAPLTGCIFPANGVVIRTNVTNIHIAILRLC